MRSVVLWGEGIPTRSDQTTVPFAKEVEQRGGKGDLQQVLGPQNCLVGQGQLHSTSATRVPEEVLKILKVCHDRHRRSHARRFTVRSRDCDHNGVGRVGVRDIDEWNVPVVSDGTGAESVMAHQASCQLSQRPVASRSPYAYNFLYAKEPTMKTMSYSESRAKYAEVLNAVTDDREEIVITRAGHEPVVIVSLEDYESLKETAYLLRESRERPPSPGFHRGAGDGRRHGKGTLGA